MPYFEILKHAELLCVVFTVEGRFSARRFGIHM
jgi:hypothetical protein